MKFLIFPLVFLLSSAGAYKFITEINSQPENFNFMTFKSQGQKLQIAYQYQKSRMTNGKTVLLLHGKHFSSVYWKQTIKYLLAEGYDVLAPDQISFGKSSQPLSYQFSFQQLAANTKLLLDSLHIPSVIIVGHSMGGMLAARFALMYPNSCTQLILENPIGLEECNTEVPYVSIDEETNEELMKTKSDLRTFMTINYFHNAWKTDYEPLLDERERLLKDTQFPAYARNMALTTDMIYTQPVCYELQNLSMPVTLIVGMEDHTTVGKENVDHVKASLSGNNKKSGKEIATRLKDCELLEIPAVGHIPHIENFELFVEKLDIALKGAYADPRLVTAQ